MRAPGRFVAVATVRLDAAGTGSATVAPASADWLVTHTAVSTSTAVRQPRADLHLSGEPTPFEGTYSGAGDASDTRHIITAGESITATWTGGDPGATATLRVSGVQVSPGQGVVLLTGGA